MLFGQAFAARALGGCGVGCGVVCGGSVGCGSGSGNSARLRFEGSSSLQRGRSADGGQVLDRGLSAAAPFGTRRGADWAAGPHGALLLILDSGAGRRTLDVECLRNGYETASRPPAL